VLREVEKGRGRVEQVLVALPLVGEGPELLADEGRHPANGGAVLCRSMDEALQATDTLAPEHLHVCVSEPDRLIDRLEHFGAAFIGQDSAEVFGDYGIGPNHVLPTGGTARSRGGLSVLTFLRVRTWLRLDESAALSGLIDDVTWLARQEGLEAHARAAERRRR